MTDATAPSTLPAAATVAPRTTTAPLSASAPGHLQRPLTLDHVPLGQAMQVQAVQAPKAAPEWADWLGEIGFLPGEQTKVLSRGQPGGDPLVVRIAQSTFALRRAEAACIQVALWDEASESAHE